jgi:hypothetical protein
MTRRASGVGALRGAHWEFGSLGSNVFFGAVSNGFHVRRQARGAFYFADAVKPSAIFYCFAQRPHISNETR